MTTLSCKYIGRYNVGIGKTNYHKKAIFILLRVHLTEIIQDVFIKSNSKL